MSLAQMIRRVAGGQKPSMSNDDNQDMEDEDHGQSAEGDPPQDGDDADEDGDDHSAEGDQLDGDDDAAEGEESDKDMSAAEKKAFAKGRSAERSRIGKILGSPKADGNPALAAHLAFKTGDSAKKALATLEHGGSSAASSGLSSRMNARGGSRTGRGGDETQVRSKDAGSSMIAALGRAGKLKGN